MRWRERGAANPVAVVIGVLVVVAVLLLIGDLVVRPSHSGPVAPSNQKFSASAGPESGTAVNPYIAARQAAMTTVPDPSWAIVSFRSYHTVADARLLVGQAEVVGLLVAAPGTFPQTIGPNDSDVRSWQSHTRDQAASDAAGLRSMIPTADPQTAAEFRADLDRLAIAQKADASGPIVFGVVLRAPAAALRALAATAEVRLVDPVGAATPDLTTVAGLRPEEQGATGTPATRPTS